MFLRGKAANAFHVYQVRAWFRLTPQLGWRGLCLLGVPWVLPLTDVGALFLGGLMVQLLKLKLPTCWGQVILVLQPGRRKSWGASECGHCSTSAVPAQAELGPVGLGCSRRARLQAGLYLLSGMCCQLAFLAARGGLTVVPSSPGPSAGLGGADRVLDCMSPACLGWQAHL